MSSFKLFLLKTAGCVSINSYACSEYFFAHIQLNLNLLAENIYQEDLRF